MNNKKAKKETGKKVFAEISFEEHAQMVEIRKNMRFSIADQIRAGIRNILKNKDNLKS